MKRLTDELIEQLYEEYETPPHVRAHCRGVTDCALRIAKALNEARKDREGEEGYKPLDLEMIYGAGMVHDMARVQDEHWVVAANKLEELGYMEEAAIVRVHMEPSNYHHLDDLTESDMINLGDRLVKEDKYVGIDERFEYIINKGKKSGHFDIEKMTERILANKAKMQACLDEIEECIGCTIDSLFENTEDNDMAKEPTLVIMAAGMGSRFGGLKQIEPISGDDEIILDFSLYDAMMAGFKKAVIIIKEENEEDFRRLLDNKARKHMDIRFAYQSLTDIPEGFEIPEERVKPWGTGHAVLAIRNLVDGPFAVINADDYYGQTAFQVMYEYLADAKEGHYAMVGFEVENTLTENGAVTRGVCEAENGMLTNIHERHKVYFKGEKIFFEEDGVETELPKGTPVSMNFWGFTEEFIEDLMMGFPEFLQDALENNRLKGEYLLPEVVGTAIREGRCDVKVLHSQDKWHGVTYKEDKEEVVNALQKMKDAGEYPQKLWQ